jgi:serine/threonine protein kinase
MSPEQGSGSKIDARSDIYSLGVVLFEMATGRVPYQAETPIAVVFKHVQDPLPPARSINPDLPEAVELVILKSLAKNPEDRYQTAADMVRAIQAAISESQIFTAAAAATTITQKPAEEPAPVPTILASAASKPAEEEKPSSESGVESGMQPTMIAKPKRGTPAWIWVVVGIVLLAVIAGGGYMLFGRGPAAAEPTKVPVAVVKPTQAATSTRVPSRTPVPSDTLTAINTLPPGGQLLSNNKLYRFEVLATGELVLAYYNNLTSKIIWSSKSKGDPKAFVMQDDGNIVLYAKNGSVIWASNKTGSIGDYFLVLQDDGNLVVYKGKPFGPNLVPIWESATAQP